MPPVPPRITKKYLSRRLWLAKITIAASLLISVGIGWKSLSSFERYGAYARVLSDVVQGIDDFEATLAWFSGREEPNADSRKLLRVELRDIVEGLAFIRSHDGYAHADLNQQWLFIESELQVNPDVLVTRYGINSGMPPEIKALWHPPEDSAQKSLEAASGRFVNLAYRIVQAIDTTSAEYQASVNALKTLMRAELRPAFRVIMNSVAEGTISSARAGLFLLVLCALAGLSAATLTGLFIYRPMLNTVITDHDALMLERDRAIASDAAKRNFLTVMSHELRTPLNGILGFTNLLLSTSLSVKQKDYAETIQSAGITLLDLLNDILDITNIEAGVIEPEKANFSLEEVASEVLSLLGPQAFAKRLDLGAYIDTSLPERMSGDAGRVRQILLKLVGNAIKFTDEGGVAIEIKRGSEREDGKTNVHFTVSDTGIGIPKMRLNEIFDHFVQVDDSSGRMHGGVGLGLPICRRLVDLLKGDMGVESILGKGSAFWFRLPLEDTLPAADPIFEVTKIDLSGRRVLVVDDNPLNRHIFRLQLEGFKADVECVPDGRAALAALSEAGRQGTLYDIAIIDHVMPEMDGITLRKLIREQPQYSRMKLIISSSGGIAFDQQARALGFDAACPKPVLQDKLIRHVQELMTSPPHRRASDRTPVMVAMPSLNAVEEPEYVPHLLVAEDNPINQRLIVSALSEAGYVVDAVGDGVDAVHAMQQMPYDLILMDIRMPVMSGVDATRHIRAMPPPSGKVPIIAMTANTLPGDREEYLAAGMNEYVPKPIDFDDLLRKIRSYLDGVTPETETPEAGAEPKRRTPAQRRPA